MTTKFIEILLFLYLFTTSFVEISFASNDVSDLLRPDEINHIELFQRLKSRDITLLQDEVVKEQEWDCKYLTKTDSFGIVASYITLIKDEFPEYSPEENILCLQFIKDLVKNGTNLNFHTDYYYTKGFRNYGSPIQIAVLHSLNSILEVLINLGADYKIKCFHSFQFTNSVFNPSFDHIPNTEKGRDLDDVLHFFYNRCLYNKSKCYLLTFVLIDSPKIDFSEIQKNFNYFINLIRINKLNLTKPQRASVLDNLNLIWKHLKIDYLNSEDIIIQNH